jgi:hypothetical protein
MRSRKITALALTGALVVGGAGAAVAAISAKDAKNAEQSVLDNAAKRLSVTPQALRDALGAAQDDQLAQAVKDGLMTQKQADAIQAERKQDGRVLGGPFGGRPGPHRVGPGFEGGPGRHGDGPMMFDELAKARGLSTTKLFEQLRAGKSLADVAKAQGKSMDDVRSALKAAAKARADKAVKDGDITQAQADKMLERLDEHLKNFDGSKPFLGRRGFRDGPPRLRGGANKPGNFMPPLPDAGGAPI